MANIATKLRLPGIKETQWQVLAGPVLIMTILAMMILPLPTFVLDLLFTFNIVLAIMILLVAMFTQNTLEFSAFPTVLLFSTLLRLALNVASTRVILMHGHNGADAAGQVIEAFGHFLVGGQLCHRHRRFYHIDNYKLYGHHQGGRAYCRSGRSLYP